MAYLTGRHSTAPYSRYPLQPEPEPYSQPISPEPYYQSISSEPEPYSPESPQNRLIIVDSDSDDETQTCQENLVRADNSSKGNPSNTPHTIPCPESESQYTAIQRRNRRSSSDSVGGLIFTGEVPNSEDCQDILDSHIRSTIDNIQEETIAYYRPPAQEPYDNTYIQPDADLIAKMRQLAEAGSLREDNRSLHTRKHSFYATENYYHRTSNFTRSMAGNLSSSDENIPNQQGYLFTDNSLTNSDLFYPSTPYVMRTHLSYLPSAWQQLNNLRSAYQAENQIVHGLDHRLHTCSDPISPNNSFEHHFPAGGEDTFHMVTSPYDIHTSATKSNNLNASASWRLQCPECSRRFNSRGNLQNHIDSVHKGIRPFVCNICEKTFAQRATLRTHIRTHTGEKPYKCNVCDRGFADLSTCKKHLRVHDGQKPYVCDICGKSFSQSGNMLRHKESHQRKDKQPCLRKLKTVN